MNTSQLKSYAPEARTAFIEACLSQAARLGITAEGNATPDIQGDVLLVGGSAFPKAVAKGREALVRRVKAHGFDATIDAIAYTWFNRVVAIRYMELHGYLDHGYRVLSHPGSDSHPEILEHAADIELTGLDRDQVVTLKLDGSKDEELYRMLILAQCNALHQAMPFLFEKIGDETELLLPANLLHTDSLIRRLVEQVDEALWQEIEIIGWLYQFYISEKKDEVIGKVVKSEDIPAATQLFTPNWIVKYMVQNSLGAQWLATYPKSPLKVQMEYYIEPAEQTDEVNAQLASITPSQLNPEELTLIDPASGSGHILVEAYELFKAIYLERGYRQGDVPQLILEKNLFGLDIDERAAQLTGFALMMKGRADDRRLFERGVKLNVMALVDSAGVDADQIIEKLLSSERVELVPSEDLFPDTLSQPNLSVPATTDSDAEALRSLVALFEHATTFGSLIQVPEGLTEMLPALKQLSAATSRDLFVSEALKRLGPLVEQAELLATQYDAVVANPPYMSSKGMNALVKKFTTDHFPEAKSDLFASFIERGYTLARNDGHEAMVTMQSWMFLSSFETMRERMLREKTIRTMAHLGARAFGSISGEVVQATSFVLRNGPPQGFRPVFLRLLDGGEREKREALARADHRFDRTAQDAFSKIPGSPIAYWVSDPVRSAFSDLPSVADVAETKAGLTTGDNTRFQRVWSEIDTARLCLSATSREDATQSGCKWFPCNSGGQYRKWFGNNETVVHWEKDGEAIRTFAAPDGRLKASPRSMDKYFVPGVTWSKISTGQFAARFSPSGRIFDDTGQSAFAHDPTKLDLVFLCLSASTSDYFLQYLSPTLSYNKGDIARIPVPSNLERFDGVAARHLVRQAQADWDAYERSWDFQSLPLLTASSDATATLESSYTAWITQNRDTIAEMKRLEEENNRLFIDAYGLADELTSDVPIEQITLTVNPVYRYGGKVTEEEQWTRFRQDTMEELISYAVGCMMGRYSMDAPGLIYAHSAGEGFDPSRYATFPADDDGIVPITDAEWFDDDAAHRLIEFISVAWDKNHLEANLTFLADNLSPKKNESSRETLRRYLCDSFFKDHLQTYKKRPIYWLFSSGKQKAFQAIVYLHRYNEGTLSRMRSEYVIPLQGKIVAQLEKLEGDIKAAESAAQSKRLGKDQAKLQKQQVELLAFDEKLRHYADQRISLDLDDGVKVNYGKFADLLVRIGLKGTVRFIAEDFNAPIRDGQS